MFRRTERLAPPGHGSWTNPPGTCRCERLRAGSEQHGSMRWNIMGGMATERSVWYTAVRPMLALAACGFRQVGGSIVRRVPERPSARRCMH